MVSFEQNKDADRLTALLCRRLAEDPGTGGYGKIFVVRQERFLCRTGDPVTETRLIAGADDLGKKHAVDRWSRKA